MEFVKRFLVGTGSNQAYAELFSTDMEVDAGYDVIIFRNGISILERKFRESDYGCLCNDDSCNCSDDRICKQAAEAFIEGLHTAEYLSTNGG